MQRIRLTVLFYAVSLACLWGQWYCQTRAAQYFDFKSGLGEHLALAVCAVGVYMLVLFLLML